LDFLNIKTVAGLLGDSRHCVLGISGGVDSMSLLTWVAANSRHLPCRITAFHVDHGIHPSSHAWAKFVADHCAQLGIQCVISKVSLEGLGNNLEYAARKARYKAFCSSGADTIMLAHHANDQCESFLMKLFRGSGVRGLKSMSAKTPCWYDENINVVRPMLGLTRSHIDAFARASDVRWMDDPSNSDNQYDRNYIRNVIWPTITDRFDIADINTLKSIEHLSEAWQLTNQFAQQDLQLVMLDGDMDWTKVRDLGYLRIKNLLLYILDSNNIYGFSINHVESFARGLISADMDSRNELRLKGFSINKIGKRIHINKEEPKAA